MEFIPVKTRRLDPPQDDLYAALDDALTEVKEGDVVAVSSKVVAIDEGNCVPIEGTDKKKLVEEESDLLIPRSYWTSPLTIVKNAFIGTSGVDESNSGDYYVKLPSDSFESAQKIHSYLTERFNLKNVGVVITDSHSSPLRRGASGISISFWGIKPTINHIGEEDLFGREMQIEVSNVVDGLAAGASLVMGEVAEQQPIIIIRDIPSLTFVEGNQMEEAYVPFHEDTYRVLYEKFLN